MESNYVSTEDAARTREGISNVAKAIPQTIEGVAKEIGKPYRDSMYAAFTGETVDGQPLEIQSDDELIKGGFWNGPGIVAGSGTFAHAVGAIPKNSLGIFGGRNAKTADYEGGFYRGEATGKLPDEYSDGAFFSRDRETAAGFAKRGGNEAPREFMLRSQRPLRFQSDLTLGDWADLVRAADSPEAAQKLVDAAPIEGQYTVDRFLRAADANKSVELMPGSAAWQMLENISGDAVWLLKRAGFDAIDTGRDVRKLTGKGIRLPNAAFDPAKADSMNILASMLGTLGGGAFLSSTED